VLERRKSARNSFLPKGPRRWSARAAGPGYRRIADRARRSMRPQVHLLALGTFELAGMLVGDWRMAMMTAVAVLIITCPARWAGGAGWCRVLLRGDCSRTASWSRTARRWNGWPD